MELSEAQRRALEAICETFSPSAPGLLSAEELGVADAVLDAIGKARPAEVKQFGQLLKLWDTKPLTALAGGGFRRFSELSQEEREAVLLKWCDARSPQRRAVFQALRKGVLTFYYALPGPEGKPNPLWEDIGYPGPLGVNPDAPPKQITPLPVTADTTLDCDVVVVGSGAGGGVAAGVLAAAGHDVVVLEAGDYYDDRDFAGDEYAALTQMYAPAPTATKDQSVALLAGRCLGGGTVINYTTSFVTPDSVRAEWASYGTKAFTGDEYSRSLEAVTTRLGVNTDHDTACSRDVIMEKGCQGLGWHIDKMPRNVRACDTGVECGFCPFGCRIGAKQSTVKTWLADAFLAGARIVVRTRARRVLVENGTAVGVAARTADGHEVTVRARAVVVACGAIQTPALLRRSGLENPNIGKHLKLHPATAVFGVFDDELRPWEGAMQSRYSDQFADLDAGYGYKFETAAFHPHIAVAYMPWRSRVQSHQLLRQLPRTSGVGILLRDRQGGMVKTDRKGEPVVSYKLSEYDRAHMRNGIETAAQVLEEAGARTIFTSQSKYVAYRPGQSGDLPSFMAEADGAGYGAGQLTLGSFHIMGTARMGGSQTHSGAKPTGETWDVSGLYICDGSAFPTASGVNPMISIEAIAHMNATALAASL